MNAKGNAAKKRLIHVQTIGCRDSSCTPKGATPSKIRENISKLEESYISREHEGQLPPTAPFCGRSYSTNGLNVSVRGKGVYPDTTGKEPL